MPEENEKEEENNVEQPVEESQVDESGKEDTKEVPVSLLEQIMETQENQQETIEKLKEENERLEAAADSRALNDYDQEQGEMIPQFRVGYWEHEGEKHAVLSWEQVKDEVGFTENGKHYFKQIWALHLDGVEDPVQVHYRNFMENIIPHEGEMVKETTERTEDGSQVTFYTVEVEETGETIEIARDYVNPK